MRFTDREPDSLPNRCINKNGRCSNCWLNRAGFLFAENSDRETESLLKIVPFTFVQTYLHE